MANEISVGQLAGSIPDVVRSMALKARYAKAIILKKVMNADKDVAQRGDRVSLSIMPTLSINDVGTGGSVTRQQLSTTAVEIVVNLWKECTVDIDDQATKQTALEILKEFSSAMGQALAAQQDVSIASEYSNLVTNVIGDATNPSPLDDNAVRLARLKLDKADIPPEDRFWVLSPDGHAELLSQARFSEAQNTGLARGLQVENGNISKLYGDPVYVSNKIQTATNAKANLYLHREALGIATQRNFRLVPLAKVQLSEAISTDVLYGVKTVREGHGVLVYSPVVTA